MSEITDIQRVASILKAQSVHVPSMKAGVLSVTVDSLDEEGLIEWLAGSRAFEGWISWTGEVQVWSDEQRGALRSKAMRLLQGEFFERGSDTSWVVRPDGMKYRRLRIQCAEGTGLLIERDYVAIEQSQKLRYQQSWHLDERGETVPGLTRFVGWTQG